MYKPNSRLRLPVPFHRHVRWKRQRLYISLRRSIDISNHVVPIAQFLPKWSPRIASHNSNTKPAHGFFFRAFPPPFLFFVEIDFTIVRPCLTCFLSFTFASEFA